MRQRERALAVVALLAAAILSQPDPARAQYAAVPEPAAYALRGVAVVQADGRRTEGVTILVRGPLIEAMGRGVAVPEDARVLEGDSLVVYPGFIDADGRAAFEFPREEHDPRRVELWNAPRSLRGFMASRLVVSHLDADGDALAPQRRAGIVAMAVHPTGAMMPGRGVLLLSRPGSATRDLVVEPALGPRFELRGSQGVYPATLFGVMASFRQHFEDARHRSAVATAHARDPRGLATPVRDADYAVLQEVLAGDLPVFFRADGAADILRVLSLAEEFGFRPIIVGGAEAWKVADDLRRRQVPVLVAMDFPEPRRWTPAGGNDPPQPLDAAAQREKEELEDRYANAGRLAAAGVTFALASGGTGDVLPGARKAVQYGLAGDAALAALTAVPARILGLGHLARIEAGLPATFLVASGPLFDDDTRILHTFVEGRREEGAPPRAAAGDPDEAVSFGGEWRMRIEIGAQVMTAILTVEQDGATFSGAMVMEGQRLPLSDGVIEGNRISAVATMDQAGQTMRIRMTGRVDGDRATGEADTGPLGMARWTAERTGPGGVR
jgi:imidazolonepropionase-like amidohydrolase